ncbi:ABC transporter substrate-binding protein [Undibacterium sp. CY18W]|uniref:ABC transporter substrate-binding protein n=1 Tax=Undibacterium hunanense TaxID=2762292 RepID=A0ABR6ZX99_9BURK|nr:ABC transporter substrate-binding protein [Undibacterium hunanense]MBC3920409.1 ABC transporter substrate-binding protein [Undibacterium hunanense]
MKILPVLSTVLALLMFACQSDSMASTIIRVAAQEASEPKFIAISQQGKPAIGGICVDIMRALEKVDPELKFVGDQTWQPRIRIDAGMNAGNIDAICGVQRITRNTSQYHFLDTVLFSVSYLLAVRADDDIDIQNWDDIRKLGDKGVILALHGFGIVDILEKMGGLKVDSGATSSLSNLNKLMAGRGRFYCHRSPGIKLSIQQAGLAKKIRLLAKPQLSEKFYMALSKTVPADQAKRISNALVALESSGELRRIFEKYPE